MGCCSGGVKRVCLQVLAFLVAQGKKLVVSVMVQDLIDLKHLPEPNRSIGRCVWDNFGFMTVCFLPVLGYGASRLSRGAIGEHAERTTAAGLFNQDLDVKYPGGRQRCGW